MLATGLYLGPTVAFSAYSASATIFLNISYAAPVLVLLIRGRGILHAEGKSPVGFRMNHAVGVIANWTSVLFVGVTSVVILLLSNGLSDQFQYHEYVSKQKRSQKLPTDRLLIDYVPAVIGIFVLIVGVHWFALGKKFQGPVSQTARLCGELLSTY
ncbi:hypothetical protein PRZ48_013892 [Zasmidium cellare]|uniref:Uncharacterized protein n=1 Tax=Zasmidium cellare TaxID=395010 RepID=A0ABR0DZD3_ZASCE|nr:hypothetical protein PRZ48_013892 [Zasmidium cellare]